MLKPVVRQFRLLFGSHVGAGRRAHRDTHIVRNLFHPGRNLAEPKSQTAKR